MLTWSWIRTDPCSAKLRPAGWTTPACSATSSTPVSERTPSRKAGRNGR
ncbi:hypothetical protein HaLaN_32604, partial [Haematococcus lacustris]